MLLLVLLLVQFRLLYTRKVNPNRVHLTTDVVINAEGKSQMSVGAEYMLKQSKLHMSIDSNMQIKSMVETAIAPGVQMQLCAEMQQQQAVYKFGFGVLMG
jgi:hypothetical protein